MVAGEPDNRPLHAYQRDEANGGDAIEEEQRRAAVSVRGQQTPLREGEPGGRSLRRGFELDGSGGEINHDGAGNTVIERVRAATAGLFAKAGRMGERLRGMAEDVWTYATGERGTERARVELEQAGAEFERAAAPLVREMNTIEQRREMAHRQRQDQLQHEKAPSRQRTHSLGNREYGD